jgi:prolyl oligopeptidase
MNRRLARSVLLLVTSIWSGSVFTGCAHSQPDATPAPKDPYLWLETIKSPRVNAWVADHNRESAAALESDPRYPVVSAEMRKIMTAQDRIPYPALLGSQNKKTPELAVVRNFWTDQKHVRGIWRQTLLKEYLKPHPRWDVLLDIDALNRAEKKSWVLKATNCRPPEFADCLIELSDGGKDEVVVREFDATRKSFIPVEGSFAVPPAKTDLSWIDADTVLIATDFGPGTLTLSGYPMQIKLWKRGTPLSDAKLVFSGKKEDVSVGGTKNFRTDSENVFVTESPSFFEEHVFLYKEGSLHEIPFPATAEFMGDFQNFAFAKLRKDWQVGQRIYPAGTLVSLPLAGIDQPAAPHQLEEQLEAVYTPDALSTLSGINTTRSKIFLKVLRNVQGEVYAVSRENGVWARKQLSLPGIGNPWLAGGSNFDDRFFIGYQGFQIPPALYLGDEGDLSAGLRKVKSLSPKYDGSHVSVDQLESVSADGTRIPYFVVHDENMKLDGTHPTLLNAYGGFEISSEPYYLAEVGKAWLEKGGVFVYANIRGGGEFGPRWHEAALKENRQRAYDDFASVAEDLFNRRITSPARLGIQGWSNGGLLMGVAFTQHPEYYRAVGCGGALLDMLRYTKLPPGASWIAEYGDPDDPREAAAIRKYSPYQNLKPGVKYPKVFFETSTEDDRVQPGHVRKMVARMEELGNPVLFYENTEGGHGAAADIDQRIKMKSLEYVYYYQQLMDEPQPTGK